MQKQKNVFVTILNSVEDVCPFLTDCPLKKIKMILALNIDYKYALDKISHLFCVLKKDE